MNKYVSNFYDVNKKTQTEQVLENMEQIDELKKADKDLQEDIEAEEQARAEADAELEYSIGDLQSQIDAFGNVFTLKGSVATISDLPAENNNVGDVYYVESEYVGYVWIDDNGSERWEQLGLPVDLSNYVTTTDLTTALDDYQEKLTAGTNITILGNTISATQPDISGLQVLSGNGAPTTSTIGKYKQFYLDESTKNLYQCTQTIYEGDIPQYFEWTLVGGVGKQNKLTAGTNITITGDTISASGGGTSTTYTQVTLGDMRSDIYTNKYKEIIITIGNNHYNTTRPRVSINISDATMTYSNLSGPFMTGPATYYFKKQVSDDGYGVTYVCEHGYDSKSKIFLYFTSNQVYIDNERTPDIDGTSTIYIYGPKQQLITTSTEKMDITLIN